MPKKYDDDDGRTVADMSGIERPPMLLPHFKKKKEAPREVPEEIDGAAPKPEEQMSADERRGYIFGALGAALLIGGIFAAAGAIAIFLMTVIWR